MGTNYYIKSEPCSHCKRADPDLHIGKSSFGWAFALHVVADRGLNSLDDWRPLLSAGRIIDERDDYASRFESESGRFDVAVSEFQEPVI